MRQVSVSLLAPQLRFVTSKAREVLYSGAFGAGKSRAVCWRLFMRASVPGAREGFARKTLASLKATTLKTLLEPEGALDPVIPPDMCTHRAADREIRIHGGGTICYFGMESSEDYQRIGSLNLSGCAVDEAVEFSERDWTMLRGRIRMPVDGLSNSLYGACNPSGPSHFLATRFGLAGGATVAHGCECVTTRTADNPYLPPDYVADLSRLTGVAHKRYFLGLWVGSDGLVYDHWDRERHVATVDERADRAIIGVDIGYANPSAFVVVRETRGGALHVAEEVYRRGMTEPQIVEIARSLCERYSPETLVVDPSAAMIIEALRRAGVPVSSANNSVMDGIRLVADRLAGGRLTVSPACPNLIREFECYEWARNNNGQKDQPVKSGDHALDALRYAVMRYDQPTCGPRLWSIGGESQSDRRGNDGW